MTRAIHSAELPGGPKLDYVEQGERSGVPLVLLHGYTDSWRSFESLLPHLPADVWAFAITQRGHGDAARPAHGYGPHDFAADLARFMDLHGINAAVIAGHSMGASIGQRFALDHPGRTLGLVLMGAFTSWRRHPAAMELWTTAISIFEDPVDPGFVRAFQESTIAQPVPPGLLDAAGEESLKVPARVWRATFEAFLAADVAEELARVEAPTLIIWGDADPICPRGAQEEILRAIAPSRLIVYPGAGHAMHWERPARVGADLASFARSVSPRAALRNRPAARVTPVVAVATA
jgi:pimeloyl-ACP methyl ester carboxylesterase